MLFPADVLDSEIRKLRGLLQMLHEDQPDVMEDVFDFHVTSLITHAAPEYHARIRSAARSMLADVQRCPVRVNPDAPEILLMEALTSA
ncbi:hypothetical protein [Stenotrophomonas sp. AB1(2024)]|uniref:hypothetical protein n=1 Tax=Stenotrophomonas sp. AB1(2024) TaxID=3132215 RepID=UPI0030A2673C